MIEPEHILDICCEVFKVNKDIVISEFQDRTYIRPRQAFALICHKELQLSHNEIGIVIGREKSTIQGYIHKQPKDRFYTERLKVCFEKVGNLS